MATLNSLANSKMDWEKLAIGALMVGVIVFIFPRMYGAMKNAPKGNSKEWFEVSKILAVVIFFVLFLIMVV